jgi:hypothetical protein
MAGCHAWDLAVALSRVTCEADAVLLCPCGLRRGTLGRSNVGLPLWMGATLGYLLGYLLGWSHP